MIFKKNIFTCSFPSISADLIACNYLQKHSGKQQCISRTGMHSLLELCIYRRVTEWTFHLSLQIPSSSPAVGCVVGYSVHNCAWTVRASLLKLPATAYIFTCSAVGIKSLAGQWWHRREVCWEKSRTTLLKTVYLISHAGLFFTHFPVLQHLMIFLSSIEF